MWYSNVPTGVSDGNKKRLEGILVAAAPVDIPADLCTNSPTEGGW